MREFTKLDEPVVTAISTTRDATVEKISLASTQVGAWGSVFAWLASNEAAVLFGIFIGLCGLIVNLIFAWRRDQRESREHAIRVRREEAEASEPE